MSPNSMKCTLCGDTKPTSEFQKEGSRRRPRCKRCIALRMQAWYRKNAKRVYAANRARREADPEHATKYREYKRIWSENNREKLREYSRAAYHRNKDKAKKATYASTIKRVYGLTIEAYNTMCEAQGNACALCCKPFVKKPHIDHDHETGVVRGILCGPCNTGIGKLGDTVESLERAVAYLRAARRPALTLTIQEV